MKVSLLLLDDSLAARFGPQSAATKSLMSTSRALASRPSTAVLISGPSGAGKRHTARLLHALTHPGSGDSAPFVELNCARATEETLEEALAPAAGPVRGTLFLDELTELSAGAEAGLLRMISEESGSLRVVGATVGEPDEVDADSEWPARIVIPPLRARREDIAGLAEWFLQETVARTHKPVVGLTRGALDKLGSYDFPGHVRELRNVIERAVILAGGSRITENDIVLLEKVAPPPEQFFAVACDEHGQPPPLEAVERSYLVRTLHHLGGRRMATARALGISYPTFLKRLRELGLDPKQAHEP